MIDTETLALDAELAATEKEIAALVSASHDSDEAQRILNRAITKRVARLQGQIGRLEHTLDREREMSGRWKKRSSEWELKAKRSRKEMFKEIGLELIKVGETE